MVSLEPYSFQVFDDSAYSTTSFVGECAERVHRNHIRSHHRLQFLTLERGVTVAANHHHTAAEEGVS